MSRKVEFSFASEAEKAEYEALARSRGLTLSQFVRWCVFDYRLNCQRAAKAMRAYRARKRGLTPTDTAEVQ